ncbi:MAG: hypothetical protein OSJ43_01170 [Oscillospiraceae bacterium]|nr:hypothetical protein [Oscillospiraceae bacterium]
MRRLCRAVFDFGTAVVYVYLQAVLEPIWGGFRGVCETSLQPERGRFGGMIVMQEKGLMPPRAA